MNLLSTTYLNIYEELLSQISLKVSKTWHHTYTSPIITMQAKIVTTMYCVPSNKMYPEKSVRCKRENPSPNPPKYHWITLWKSPNQRYV